MRRAPGWLALWALAACGGAPEAGGTTPTAAPVAPVASGPIVPSEGALNRPAGEASPSVEPVPAPATAQPANILTVAPGFAPDPIVRRGRGGGPVRAESFGESCRGFLPGAPSFVLKVDAPMPQLRVLVHMAGDATLMIQLVDGSVRCNDDTEGLDPIIQGAFPPGRHRIFVGTYGERGAGTTPYTLAVTTQASLSTRALDGLPDTR